MSFGLTATATRPLIDLPGESPPPPKTSTFVYPPAPLPILGLPHEEPPLKRRRVDDAVTRRRSLKECLQDQVLPHVSEVIRTLSPVVYRVNDIAVQAVTTLANSPRFRTRLDETKGFLTPQDEDLIAVRARDEVKRLASLTKYRNSLDFSSSSIKPQFLKSLSGQGSEDTRPNIGTITKSGEANQYPSPDTLLPNYGRLPYRLRTQRKTPQSTNTFFRLRERPYRSTTDRDAIARGSTHLIRSSHSVTSQPTIYHVDFTTKEVSVITEILSTYEGKNISVTLEALAQRCRIYNVPVIVGDALPGRVEEDISNFCSDLKAGTATPLTESRTLSASHDNDDERGKALRSSRVTSLLLARELEGNKGFGRMRSLANFQNEFKKLREDELQVVAEYTNCAGDITAGSWVSDSSIICGTTAHSDSHNQQYNKPGNLLLCSATSGTLRSFPHHRIPRPRVQKGENSTDAMRRSQDPWLYSSVVSSDYDPGHDLAFTSSFDRTVKVWKVDHNGQHMECLATWEHTGNVNFVAVARDGSGRVATAADSTSEAVRVYTINRDDIAESTYQSFSCSRTDADGSDKWAYFPATMQWGRTEVTSHLLVVGYSPRSTSGGEDHDIPEDKRNSGEITLWDAAEGRRVPVMTASTANVFEVAWHPKLARFLVATTPCSNTIDHGVRTQVHIFQRDRERADGAYGQFQTLDCKASDINELTIIPNSVIHAYVTAGCTDGSVYIWDTAQGDKPIHTLEHGDPVDEFHGDREREDTGVKFTAWGSSLDRFYTGSSDGVVKVWNVRNRKEPFVRNVLEAPGPISFGAFSPDKTKLAIGDATGRVFILSVDQRDEHEAHFITLPGSARRVRRPRPLIPHPEPAPPYAGSDDTEDCDDDASDYDIADYSRWTYLDTEQLVMSGNPIIGAVQGPLYSTSGLFRREAHLDEDPTLPLLAVFERNQQASDAASRGTRRRSVRRLKSPGPPDGRVSAIHRSNVAKDLDTSQFTEWEMDELVREGAVLSIEEAWEFDYEETPDEGSGDDE